MRATMQATKATLSIIAFLCAVAFLGFAQATSDSDTRSKLLALENAWNLAVQTRDTKALDAIFDNALVYVDYDGRTLTKAEFLLSVKNYTANPQQVATEAMSAYVWRDAAIVTGIYHEKGVRDGKPFHRRGRFIDTWIFKNGSWVCVAAQATLIQR
jgi:ketosteroid isomerase-like protein